MGIYEIDDLLQESLDLWNDAREEEIDRERYIFGIKQIPNLLELDVGVPQSEDETEFAGEPVHIFESGRATMELAAKRKRLDLIYDWCAFLINFWSHMPESEDYDSATIRRDWFEPMRELLSLVDLSKQVPKHPTLTLYPQGNDWFDDEHNELIRAFLSQ